MAKPVPRTPVFDKAIKSFGLFFPPVRSEVQIANMTRGQISAREKGGEQLFHQAASAAAGAHTNGHSPERGLLLTPTSK